MVVDTAGIDDLNMMLQEADLFEAQAKGVPFTWWNNNGYDPISKRIDHALINQHWASLFQNSYADFLEPDQYDHAPCGFKVPSLRRRRHKPFRFYHHVIDHPSYTATVSDVGRGCCCRDKSISVGPLYEIAQTSPKESQQKSFQWDYRKS